MQTLTFKDWAELRVAFGRYAALGPDRRQQLLFRGMGRSDWPLQTTLDRIYDFADDAHREATVTDLLSDFSDELLPTSHDPASIPTGEGLELLARHHGLPSPLLDWTQSPYIAAFFAYADALEQRSTTAAVWVLDRARLPDAADNFELLQDRSLLRYNARAIQQRGVFLRVPTAQSGVETLLGPALWKFTIHAVNSTHALTDLDEMTINHTYLFADVDAAARTARIRNILGQEPQG